VPYGNQRLACLVKWICGVCAICSLRFVSEASVHNSVLNSYRIRNASRFWWSTLAKLPAEKIQFKLYSIIRYFLLGMLIIYLILLIIVLFNLINYLIHFIIKIIWDKLRSYAGNSGLFDSKAKGHNKPPKKPQSTNMPNPQAKQYKDIKKKASEMKQKLLELQKEKLNQSDWNLDSSSIHNKNTNSFRNWNHQIYIENRPNLSLKDQLNKMKFELEAYKIQEKKFEQSINNIKKGKENFYPDQSKYLWKDYIEVIKHLNFNLKSMKKNLKKQVSAAVKQRKK
jgi:hypothetical protein